LLGLVTTEHVVMRVADVPCRFRDAATNNPYIKKILKAYNKVKNFINRRSRRSKVAAKAAKLEDGTAYEKEPLVDPNDLSKIPLWRAIIEGYLLNDEYAVLLTLVGMIFLVVVMGLVIAGANKPHWMGHLIWSMTLVTFYTVSAVIKWFNTYEIDR
jgi:hypothetical protein